MSCNCSFCQICEDCIKSVKFEAASDNIIKNQPKVNTMPKGELYWYVLGTGELIKDSDVKKKKVNKE